MNLQSWHKQWTLYKAELAEARKIPDEKARQFVIENAEDKFNWWMDTYPRSDAFNQNFDESLESYRALKNKRRK